MYERGVGSAKMDFVIASKYIMSVVVTLVQSSPVNDLKPSAKGQLLTVFAIMPMLSRTLAVWER